MNKRHLAKLQAYQQDNTLFIGSDDQFIQDLRDSAIKSTEIGTIGQDIHVFVDAIGAYQQVNEAQYQKNRNLLHELQDSRRGRLVQLLRRFARIKAVRTGGVLMRKVLREIRYPKYTYRYLHIKYKEWQSAKKFKNAWAISDRADQASDNGILFYRYVVEKHPEVNAFFILSKNSSDYEKLRSEGVRLIEYGSEEHRKLAQYADADVSAFFNFIPFDVNVLKRKRKVVQAYISHGIDQSDVSVHYSSLDIDIYCIATGESCEFYKSGRSKVDISRKNLQATGLCRHDLVRKKMADKQRFRRDTIVLAPTWRRSLLYKQGSSEKVSNGDLEKSVYYKNYVKLFNSEELKNLSKRYSIVLIPHPEMASRIGEFNIPKYMSVKTYSELKTEGLYELALRTKLFISDYTSTTFDFAFLGANIVYFNFDEDNFYSDDQQLYRSWFKIERDGFGPAFKSLTSLKHHIASPEDWTRYEDNILKVWDDIPSNSSELIYLNITKLVEQSNG